MKTLDRRPHLFPGIIFTGLSIYLFACPHHYGQIGDYAYYFLHLLSNRIYFLNNGLMSLPYYSPVYVAGVPMYASPSDLQFSVVGFFFNFLPQPYLALGAAFIVCTVVAYFGCFALFRRLEFDSQVAACGALLFSLNGFIVTRWIVGHLNFHTYCLLPWILTVLFDLWTDPSPDVQRRGAVTLGLLISAMVYGSGVHPFFIVAFSAVAFQVCLRFFVGGKTSWTWFLFAGLVFALASLSKLIAAVDCMRQFPRLMPNDIFSAKQVVEMIINGLANPVKNISSPPPPGLDRWDECAAYSGLSVVLFALFGIWFALSEIRKEDSLERRRLHFLAAWAAVSFVGSAYLMEGNNLFWMFAKHLPILKSNHAVQRFVGALPIVVIAMATACWQHLLAMRWKRTVVFLFGLICAGDLIFYHLTNDDHRYAQTPRLEYTTDLKSISVSKWDRIGDPDRLLEGIAGYRSINPIFGYVVAEADVDPALPPTALRPDGTFNVNDPAAMIYPRELGRPPWSRIPASVGRGPVEDFLSFRDPHFFVPLRQRIANKVSLISWAGSIMVLIF